MRYLGTVVYKRDVNRIENSGYLYHPVMVKIDIMWRIIEVRALLLIVEGHPGPYMPIPYIRSIMGTIIMILVLIILYIGWGFWIQFW